MTPAQLRVRTGVRVVFWTVCGLIVYVAAHIPAGLIQ